MNTFNKFNNKIMEREIIETKTTLETYKTFFCKLMHKHI